MRYELTFWGTPEWMPRHKRWHRTPEAATAEARRVLAKMESARAAHPAIIYYGDDQYAVIR